MIGLFQEARAVDMEFSTAPTSVRGTQTFVVDLTIPATDRVPIETIEAVVEQQADGRTDKVQASVVARAKCAMQGQAATGCGSSLSSFTTSSAAIPRIELTNIFEGDPANEKEIGHGYVFGSGTIKGDRTGYGYDESSSVFNNFGYGYGYGYETGDRSSFNEGAGTGYGYSNDDITLRFAVDINGNQLDQDTHYLTVLADTGSGTIGILSSPFTEFTVARGGGGGPAGPGSGAGAGPITVNVGGSFDGEDGQTIKVTGNLPSGVLNLQIILDRDCDNCRVEITRSMTRPGGTQPTEDTGFTPIYFLDISVVDEDGTEVTNAVASAWLNFEITQPELPSNSAAIRALLLRHVNPWVPLDTELTTDADAEPLEYNATLPGFSNFAVVVDAEGPTFSGEAPTSVIQQVTPVIEADFADNRAIDPTSFELFIDGVEADDDTGDLTVTLDGFTYIPGTALSTSEHAVEATVSDISGLTTTEDWTFTVSTPDCPAPPRILSTQPTDGGTLDVGGTVEVTIEAGTCDIDTGSLTLNGEEMPGFIVDIAAGETETVTAVLPTAIAGGETVNAVATIEDTDGNTAQRSWSFETEQDDGPGPGDDGPDEDGGIPGWVWILILLLIAAAAIGGYVYYQQQEGQR